jgi:dTDP-glucose 4,6-dehydratase
MADAVMFLLSKDWKRDKVNIVGEKEVDNLTLAQTIADIVGKPLIYEMTDFHSSRPGHDLRYALDGTKLTELGWNQPKGFEESLEKTIRWTLERPNWYLTES